MSFKGDKIKFNNRIPYYDIKISFIWYQPNKKTSIKIDKIYRSFTYLWLLILQLNKMNKKKK